MRRRLKCSSTGQKGRVEVARRAGGVEHPCESFFIVGLAQLSESFSQFMGTVRARKSLYHFNGPGV
jgi:hypothetical protein